MEDHGQTSSRGSFLGGLCVTLLMLLLLLVCSYCYPDLEEKASDWVMGLDTGPVREAFRIVSEGLEEGAPIRDTVSDAMDTLLEKD